MTPSVVFASFTQGRVGELALEFSETLNVSSTQCRKETFDTGSELVTSHLSQPPSGLKMSSSLVPILHPDQHSLGRFKPTWKDAPRALHTLGKKCGAAEGCKEGSCEVMSILHKFQRN